MGLGAAFSVLICWARPAIMFASGTLKSTEAVVQCREILALERNIRKEYVLDQARSAYHTWPVLLQNGLNSNPKPSPGAAGVVGLVDSSRKASKKGQGAKLTFLSPRCAR
jgi:hypothetical protein